MTTRTILIGAIAAAMLASAGTASAGHQIGGGIHYLATVGDIKDNPEVDDSNFNFVASYKYSASLISVVADVEFVPDYLGSDEMLYQPQAFLLVGGFIYGGAGVGFGYIDGEWFDDPFYALRAGVDIPLGSIHLDVNANYRFLSTKAFDTVDDQDLDSVTFGAVVRFGL